MIHAGEPEGFAPPAGGLTPCALQVDDQSPKWIGRATDMLRCALRTQCPHSEPCSGLVRQLIESRWRR